MQSQSTPIIRLRRSKTFSKKCATWIDRGMDGVSHYPTVLLREEIVISTEYTSAKVETNLDVKWHPKLLSHLASVHECCRSTNQPTINCCITLLHYASICDICTNFIPRTITFHDNYVVDLFISVSL